MIDYDSNVYYHPEMYGFRVVGEADAGETYNFDKFMVWKRPDGSFTWASDSGCSCPSPFEEANPAELPVGSARDVLTDLTAWVGIEPERFYDWDPEEETYEWETWKRRHVAASTLRVTLLAEQIPA